MSQLERLQKARKEERGNTAILLPVAVTVETGADRPALSLPRQEDGVHEVISKLAAILDTVRAGRSISEGRTPARDPSWRRTIHSIHSTQVLFKLQLQLPALFGSFTSGIVAFREATAC